MVLGDSCKRVVNRKGIVVTHMLKTTVLEMGGMKLSR